MGVRPLTPLLVAFDGVVVDSLGFWEAALAEVLGPAVAPGADLAPFFDVELPEALAAAGLDAARAAAARRRLAAAARAAYPLARPLPLLPQLLAELAAGRRLLVVAAVARAAVAARLAALGLAGAEAVGPDGAPAVASERATLLAAALAGSGAGAARPTGASGEPPWFVVDTVADARLAAAVGARPLGVTWGRQGPERLRAAGVEEVVDTPVALARAVDPAAAADLLGLG